ncbi:Cellulose synthase [Heracleum sosnowskyi]|uniref:Cellulose synthase n=1 Tax=Heracleum sosnowskyi TaxID=360622 RepID=A0AAD8IB59_9APIA|nr:Cellulose synthase [Heracleum sosnowskyi]
MERSNAGLTSRNVLHTSKYHPHAFYNRVFAVTYTLAIFALLYHHAVALLHSPNAPSICLLIADFILAFMWSTTQSYRMRPMIRQVFPENLEKSLSRRDFPPMDIFICTADPYKEPPINVVNTALSVMAYDYPTEKMSVKKNIMERCPDVYLSSNYLQCSETEEIKVMYEIMKTRVEYQLKRGKVSDEYIFSEQERKIFDKWSNDFTPTNHPTLIQVLLESCKDKDVSGTCMPNLIYVSREKNSLFSHQYKAGALNALLRVSAIMTNAPLVLTLDCDMYSNDPTTPHRVLCYLSDASIKPELGYIQFPQRFHGLNKADIYGSEFLRLNVCNPMGMDGFAGPNYGGSGCFFQRRAFFGGPSTILFTTEIEELSPNHIADKPLASEAILQLAHHVADCSYENNTTWGTEIGLRYKSLSEDYYTGYRLQCDGWKSVLCHPDRPAFLGDIPITLIDSLNQNKRWSVGPLDVAISKYCPLTFGVSKIGFLMAYGYAYFAFLSSLSIPITIYAFLPQLALLARVSVFPKATDLWVCLYIFLFLGAYAQDCFDCITYGGTLRRWWSEQRVWLARGVSSYVFGLAEYISKHLNIGMQGFNVTSKVFDEEQKKRYDQGKFEFGVPSPMFVPIASASIINLVAFLDGSIHVLNGGSVDELFVQIFVAGFAVLNSLPVYEAMVLRRDKGRMPTKITVISTFVAAALYAASVCI